MQTEYRECNQCGNTFFAYEDWKKICIDCWKKNKNINTNTHNNRSSVAIDENMLKILIRLCHPDKHQNSEMSNKATVYLLSLRK